MSAWKKRHLLMPLKVYDGSGNNWHIPSMLEVPRSSDNCSGPLMRTLRRASQSDWLSFIISYLMALFSANLFGLF